MDEKTIESEVLRMIEEITSEKDLHGNLRFHDIADSLDAVEIIMGLEEALEIEIDDNYLMHPIISNGYCELRISDFIKVVRTTYDEQREKTLKINSKQPYQTSS
ncbi:MAG: hypothetical protein WDZ77_01890 [Candidatus Pacearchaeota archaeon]